MRPRWHVIHFRGCCCSNHGSSLHQTVNLMRGPDCPLWETLYKDSSLLVLSDLKAWSLSLEKITDILIIDLEITSSNHEGALDIGSILNVSEDLLHSPRDYTSLRIILMILKTFHSVSLSRSSLTICEDRSIISFENRQHSWSSCILIDMRLSRIRTVNIVKGELMWSKHMRIFLNVSLTSILCNLCTQILLNDTGFVICSDLSDRHEVQVIIHLSLERRPNSNHHSEVLVTATLLQLRLPRQGLWGIHLVLS